MKKLFILMLVVSGCTKEINHEQTTAFSEQQTTAATQTRVNIPDQIHFTQFGLYPEGIAFDKFNNRFLVSSFGQGPIGTPYYGTGTIGAVSFNGDYTPFIHDPELKSILGLHIDEAHKRVVVAVTDSWYGDVAKVGVYDLNTGNRIWLIDLAPIYPNGVHLADDLTIDPEGNIYITDTRSPVIYKVDMNGHGSVFFEDQYFAKPPVFSYYWVGFNGIVYDNSGFLIVGFYAGSFVHKPSLVKIPVNDPNNFSVVSLDFPVAFPDFSPDGLLLSRDGKELIVVDNKFFVAPGEIVHLSSNDHWASGKRIESFTTGMTFPTTATTNGKDIFVIYSFVGVPSRSEFIIQKMPFENIQGF